METEDLSNRELLEQRKVVWMGWENRRELPGAIDFRWIINDLVKCCAYRPNNLPWSEKSTLCSGLCLETVEPAR